MYIYIYNVYIYIIYIYIYVFVVLLTLPQTFESQRTRNQLRLSSCIVILASFQEDLKYNDNKPSKKLPIWKISAHPFLVTTQRTSTNFVSQKPEWLSYLSWSFMILTPRAIPWLRMAKAGLSSWYRSYASTCVILKLDHEAVMEAFPLRNHWWQGWSSALQKLIDSKEALGNLHYKPVIAQNGRCPGSNNSSTTGYSPWHAMTLSKIIWYHLMLCIFVCPSQAFAPNQVVIPKRDRMHVLMVTFAQEGINCWFSKKDGNPNRTRNTGRMAANTKKDISLADQWDAYRSYIDLQLDLQLDLVDVRCLQITWMLELRDKLSHCILELWCGSQSLAYRSCSIL